jgi:hypothetical protein
MAIIDNYFAPAGELIGCSTLDKLTAFAGGGQGGATLLNAEQCRVTTVATTGDSVKLPPSVAGGSIVVINSGANSMNVFPATGETINALAANTALAIAAVGINIFYCFTTGGGWFSK